MSTQLLPGDTRQRNERRFPLAPRSPSLAQPLKTKKNSHSSIGLTIPALTFGVKREMELFP